MKMKSPKTTHFTGEPTSYPETPRPKPIYRDRNICPICGCKMDFNDEKKQFECNGVRSYHSLTLSPFWTNHFDTSEQSITEDEK